MQHKAVYLLYCKFTLHFFISVINQLDAQNFCFTISLFHASICFEHLKMWRRQMLYNTILTSWWWTHMLETCRGMKYTNSKTKILCIKLVNYWDKYTEMHGQQNVKIHSTCFRCQPHSSSGVHKAVTTASGTGHIFCASFQRGQASLATLEGGSCTVLICVASRWTIVDIAFLHFARLLPYTALKQKSLE